MAGIPNGAGSRVGPRRPSAWFDSIAGRPAPKRRSAIQIWGWTALQRGRSPAPQCDGSTPLTLAAVAERVIALRGLDGASGAVRSAMEGAAGRVPRRQRAACAVRNPDEAAFGTCRAPSSAGPAPQDTAHLTEPVRVCAAAPTAAERPVPMRERRRRGLRAARNPCPLPAARHHADARGSYLRSFRCRREPRSPRAVCRIWIAFRGAAHAAPRR
jgi:hypothetical protein